MLPASIRSLILDEQARQGNRFVDQVDVEAYLTKLGDKAEVLSDEVEGRCRGFVAFYCNDRETRQAFITLVLVDPRDRGLGIASALVRCALELAKRRGFTTCRLEVAKDNDAAQAMYRRLGFQAIEDRAHKDLLEIGL